VETLTKLATLLQWELGLFLGGLAAVVFYQMLAGKINTKGLLQEKNGEGKLSWGRVQLLLFTFTVAYVYLFQVLDHPTQFPEIPQEWLLLLGGSNLAYLGEKAFNLVIRGMPRL
jgi:hypothetical protein